MLWTDELRLCVGADRLVRSDSADSADDSLIMIMHSSVKWGGLLTQATYCRCSVDLL
jgi:hypothetical protein